MARIMFTWELGGGSGHMSPYMNLVSDLKSGGHEIYYAVKNLEKVFGLMQNRDITWFQSPTVLINPKHQVTPCSSYAHIIYNAGFNDPYQLAGMIKAWQNLFRLVKPDLLIFDFSPSAMLAAREMGIRTLACGTGFHLPPESVPVKSYLTELGYEENIEEVRAFEDRLLVIINHALELCEMQPISHLYQLMHADSKILRTLPEMDHYTGRTNEHYAGLFRSPDGQTPVWPTAEGPRIFAYLKPFGSLSSLLDTITRKGFPTLVHYDEVAADIIKKYSSDTLQFVKQPLDMRAVGETADIAICNASHGTTTELLLQGVPILLLPLRSEQHLVARNAEKLGAALAAPYLKPKGMHDKLNALIADKKYKQAAVRFSEKYSDSSGHHVEQEIRQQINALLG